MDIYNRDNNEQKTSIIMINVQQVIKVTVRGTVRSHFA